MVAVSNAWGLAHQAWMADLDNAVLESKLNDAIAAQKKPVHRCMKQRICITRSRKRNAVMTVYKTPMPCGQPFLQPPYAAMENPVATGAGGEPDLGEITEMLYDDLPDAPTGSYIGSMGLPIATGQTRISVSEWVTDLYDGVDAPYQCGSPSCG